MGGNIGIKMIGKESSIENYKNVLKIGAPILNPPDPWTLEKGYCGYWLSQKVFWILAGNSGYAKALARSSKKTFWDM